MSLVFAKNALISVNGVVSFKIRLPWLAHIALVLAALPVLIWATGGESSFETLHASYAGPISALLPLAKPFFDPTDLDDSYSKKPSTKMVLLHQPVYRLWWLLVQVAATTVAYLSVLHIIP